MPDLFDELQQTLSDDGASAAIDKFCAHLREQQDFTGLFYALLMKKRHELGVSPNPMSPASSLPTEVQAEYEAAIREAANVVGKLCLDAGAISVAWHFYRMLGETEPIGRALEKMTPTDAADVEALVGIAYHEGVHPKKGFDLVLDRLGICSAITLIGGQDFPHGPEVRDHCLKRLVRALHAELVNRLHAEIERAQNFRPTSHNVPEILAGREWLFANDGYHIDTSHLSAVVQMSIHLPKCEELDLARELCVYGELLSPQFRCAPDPPFEEMYCDYSVYLATLAGENVKAGLAHFRSKIGDESTETTGTYPAEVFVNLLLRLGRNADAIEVARRHLAHVDSRQLTCPGILQLCETADDYQTLAQVARERNDTVQFVAALLAANASERKP